MLTLGILAFSTWIYAQVNIDTPVIMDVPDATPPIPPIVYPGEVYPEEVIPTIVIQDKIYEPDPITVMYSPDVFEGLTANSLRGSFSQETVWSLRNNFGFSLSAHEGYYFSDYPDKNIDKNPDENTEENQDDDTDENPSENPDSDSTWSNRSSSATLLSARVFTNYTNGKSTLHLDYGAGYSFFPKRRNSLDDIEHDVNAAYVYRMGKKARFQIQDHLSSSSNDPLGNIFSLNSSYGRIFSGSSYYDIIFTRQRYTRNTVTTALNTDATGKGTNVRLFGSYDNYWYGEQDSETNILKDYYSATVGAGINQRITRWLSLGSSYTIQLNNNLKESRTHRVEISNLQFDLSPNVEVHASGGLEITEDADVEIGYRMRVRARTGISYSTEARSLYANYSRTMMSVSGSRRLLPSDTVLIGLGQPITDRANLRMTGYYQRSSDFHFSGHLTAYQGQVSMEYLLGSGFVASVNYSRRYQENSISALAGIPYYERSTFTAGLQYSWPSRRSRY